ncbi:hypothetical protein [Brucella intermedia]
MHMLLVITGGLLLCGVFALFGKLWGGDMASVVTGLKLFIPVWLVVALINMWVGVTRAGYTFAQELPILIVVFAVPAAIATLLVWQMAREVEPPLRATQFIVGEEPQMSGSLPPALQSAVEAINAGDTDAFVAAFSSEGVINDWGRVLKGADGVRSWAHGDAIGAQARMTVVEATTTGDTTHIVFDWQSRVFNGRSEAYVTLVDGLVAEFRIPAK